MAILTGQGTNYTGTANDDIILVDEASLNNPDSVAARGGADVVIGDSDLVSVDAVATNNSIATATNIDDAARWSTQENPLVADDGVPYTLVAGQGSGSADFFSVTVGAGQTLTVDMDFAAGGIGGPNFDSLVTLRDGGGAALAASDDSDTSAGGLGSLSALDSFRTFTNTTGVTQVFYIEVNAFGGGGVPNFATYLMYVSVTGHANTNIAQQDDDTLLGEAGDDFLVGNGGDDSIDGGADSDTLLGGSGRDTLLGGSGDDRLYLLAGDVSLGEIIDGGGDTDRLVVRTQGSDSAFPIFDLRDATVLSIEILEADGENALGATVRINADQIGGGGFSNALVLDGAGRADRGDVLEVYGTGISLIDLSGFDLVGTGTEDAIRVFGASVAETIIGTVGNDDLRGGDGRDTLVGGLGNDTLDGEGDIDTADYSGASGPVSIGLDFSGSGIVTGAAGNDTLTSIEGVIGSEFDDVMIVQTFEGTVFGGDGADRISIGTTNVSASLVDAGLGNDTVRAANNTDYIGDVDGGEGTDTFDVSISTFAMSLNLATETHEFFDFFSPSYLLRFENVIGTQGNDEITGDSLANFLDGQEGNDTILGGGGNDTIAGSFGNDSLVGGAGDADVLDYSDLVAGVNVSVGFNATGKFGFANTDTFRDFEHIIGTQFDDTLIGDPGASANEVATLEGGAGNDLLTGAFGAENDLANGTRLSLMDGGADNDTIRISLGDYLGDVIGGSGVDLLDLSPETASGYVVDLASQTHDDGFGFTRRAEGFENVTGTQGDDEITGDENDNVLDGQDGADTLLGGGGADTIRGRDGADSIEGGEGADLLSGGPSLIGAQGFGDGADTIRGGAGNDTIIGGAFNDQLFGDAGDDLFQVFGGDDPGDIDGGLDTDTFDASAITSRFLEIDLGAAGTIRLEQLPPSLGAVTGTIVNVENVIGTQNADSIAGDDGANTLQGGGGDDTIIGRGGADSIETGSGQASIDAGEGDDTITLGDGGDTIDAGAGSDLIQGVLAGSVLDLGTGDDTVRIELGQSFDGLQITNFGVGDEVFFVGANASVLDKFNFTFSAYQLFVPDSVQLIDFAGTGTLEVSVNLSQGARFTVRAPVEGTAGNDTLATEPFGDLVIRGLGGDDSLTAGGAGSYLDGGAGNDTLVANVGFSWFFGGDDDDLILWNGSSSRLGEVHGGAGRDTVDFSAITTKPFIIDLAAETHNSGGAANLDPMTGIEAVIGTQGNDSITGDSVGNFLDGQDGDDTLLGGGGDDTLIGGLGNDSLDGGAGALDWADYSGAAGPIDLERDFSGDGTVTGEGTDTLRGIEVLIGTGSGDTIDVFLGADHSVFGGEGNDDLAVAKNIGYESFADAGGGDDTVRGVNISYIGDLDGGAGTDTFDVSAKPAIDRMIIDLEAQTHQFVTFLDLSDLLRFENVVGTQGADEITGDAGANELDGQDGNDTIQGRQGNDTILGGEGADSIRGNADDDSIEGGAGGDTLFGDSGDDTLKGDSGDDVIRGFADDDLLEGGIGDDSLRGDAGDDTLLGGDDNDTLDGSAGVDQLFGGAGNDLLIGRMEGETLDGGTGRDTVDYSALTGPIEVFVNFGGSGDAIGTGGTDTISGVEVLIGTAFSDRGNVFLGAEATLFAGDGNDSFIVSGSGTTGSLADMGAGNDTVEALNFSFIGDVDGGDGTDTFDVGAWTASGMRIDLTAEEHDLFAFPNLSALRNFENVVGTQGDDEITGDAGANALDGSGGADTIEGRQGADTILGGEGADSLVGNADDDLLEGGAGNDTVFGHNGNDTVRGGEGDDFLRGFSENDLLEGGIGDDSLRGDAGNDTLIGGDDNDTLDGSAGVDVMEGGAGDDVLIGRLEGETLDGGGGIDTAEYAAFSVALGIDLLGGLAAPAVFAGPLAVDSLVGIENAVGGQAGDTIVGDNAGNLLDGQDGGDSIEGRQGADTILGGEGADSIRGNADDDSIEGGAGNDTLFGDFGNDTVKGDSGDDVVRGFADDDLLEGGIGDDFLQGDAGNDTLLGGDDNDTLDGSAGVDVMEGGAGDDVLIGRLEGETLDGGEGIDTADYSGASGPIDVDLSNGAGTVTGGAGSDTLAGIDVLIGTGFADTVAVELSFNGSISSGAGDDDLTVRGRTFFNSLADAGDGDDTVRAVDGNYVGDVDGGTGTDTFDASAQSNRMRIDLAAEQHDFFDFPDLAALRNFENVVGTQGDDEITGDAGANALEGSGGADTIEGRQGADTILGGEGADSIRGNADDDSIEGGAGGDTLFGDSGDDTVKGDAGDDLLRGFADDDLLEGGIGNDSLRGDAGNDTLIGGADDDLLTGNFDADVFVFANGHGQDTITDFDVGTAGERIDLSAVTAITDLAGLNAAAVDTVDGVLIVTGIGTLLLLEGVLEAQLTADHFDFV